MPLHWRVNCAFVLRLITLAASTARADITQTAVLGDGWYLNLDTGKVTAAPAAAEVYDLRYTNLTIAPQGSAKVYNLGTRTAQQFANLTEPQIRAKKKQIRARRGTRHRNDPRIRVMLREGLQPVGARHSRGAGGNGHEV